MHFCPMHSQFRLKAYIWKLWLKNETLIFHLASCKNSWKELMHDYSDKKNNVDFDQKNHLIIITWFEKVS